MYPVSAYRRVRIDHDRNGLGLRELSRKYGYHRKTIKKMLEFSIPPGYQRKSPPLAISFILNLLTRLQTHLKIGGLAFHRKESELWGWFLISLLPFWSAESRPHPRMRFRTW